MKRFFILTQLILAAALLLAACGAPASAIPATGGSTAAPTPPAVGTAGQPADNLSVTLADDGKTVSLKVGQTFLLNLGPEFNWSPVVADQSIVRRLPNFSVIRGAQGIYKAYAPGKTILSATGDPACRQETPACAMPSRAFQVTLEVSQ